MRSRTYRHRVRFERLTATPDDAGQVDETNDASWTALGDRYAEVVFSAGTEATTERQTRARLAATITLREDTLTRSLTARDRVRIVGTGQTLGLTGNVPVENDGHERTLTALGGDL